jgi:hypothetical protein
MKTIPATVIEGAVTVSSGTPVQQLSATSQKVLSLLLVPDPANSGTIKAGISNPPIIPAPIQYPNVLTDPVQTLDLNQFFFQGTNVGDKLLYVATLPPGPNT